MVVLGLLAGTALFKVYTGNGVAESSRISLDWFNPLDDLVARRVRRGHPGGGLHLLGLGHGGGV